MRSQGTKYKYRKALNIEPWNTASFLEARATQRNQQKQLKIINNLPKTKRRKLSKKRTIINHVKYNHGEATREFTTKVTSNLKKIAMSLERYIPLIPATLRAKAQ